MKRPVRLRTGTRFLTEVFAGQAHPPMNSMLTQFRAWRVETLAPAGRMRRARARQHHSIMPGKRNAYPRGLRFPRKNDHSDHVPPGYDVRPPGWTSWKSKAAIGHESGLEFLPDS